MAKKDGFSTDYILKNGARIFHECRWANGIVVCPYCGCPHVKEYDGYKYKCLGCKTRFSDKTRTLMHGSRLSVEQWMQAVYEMVIDNKISSNALAIKIDVIQKTAWLMQAKIRYAMDMDGVQLSGVIAQDEMYIGGCLSNFHYGRKLRLLREYGLLAENSRKYDRRALQTLNEKLKQPVFGMNDGNKIVLYATPNPIESEYIHGIFGKHVSGDSVVVSDCSKLYNKWEDITGTKIFTNNHKRNQYITINGLSSNGIENTFSWFKRGFTGRITHCKPKYAQLYLNEFCFRYNTRKLSPEDRLVEMVKLMCGKQVTYKDIRAYNPLTNFEQTKKRFRKHFYTNEDIKEMFDINPFMLSIRFGKTTYYREDFE